MSLLDVKNLKVEFETADGVVSAVNNVNSVSYTHLTLPTN